MSDEMKKIRWTLSIGLLGCKRQGEFEVEADASEGEIWEIAEEQANQKVEIFWEEIRS